MKFENIVIHTDYSCLTGGVEEQILTLSRYYLSKKNTNKILLVNSDTYYGYTEIKKEFTELFDEIYICNDQLSFQNFKNRISLIDNQKTCVLSLKPFAFRMFSNFFINSKVILQFRGDIDKRYYNTFEGIYKEISFDYFGVMSDEMLNEFPFINSNTGVELINFGTYYHFNKMKLDLRNKFNSKAISIISRVSREKKLEDLINIIHRLPDNDFTFQIYGEYENNENYIQYHKELVQLIKELELDDKIIFNGYIDSLDEVYCNSFLLLHSSETEGIPRGVIEAAFYGTPCILKDSFVMAKHIVCEDYMCCENNQQFIDAINSFAKITFEEYCDISSKANTIASGYEINETRLDKLFNTVFERKNNRNMNRYNEIHKKVINTVNDNTELVNTINILKKQDEKLNIELKAERNKSSEFLKIIREYDNRKYIKIVRKARKMLNIDK